MAFASYFQCAEKPSKAWLAYSYLDFPAFIFDISGPKKDLAHQLLGEVNKLLMDHD